MQSTTKTKLPRFRLVQDDDGHWYLIAADKEQAFESWVRYTQDPAEMAEPDEDFEDSRLSGSPSLITFTDPDED